jgi:hypothetical protein
MSPQVSGEQISHMEDLELEGESGSHNSPKGNKITFTRRPGMGPGQMKQCHRSNAFATLMQAHTKCRFGLSRAGMGLQIQHF